MGDLYSTWWVRPFLENVGLICKGLFLLDLSLFKLCVQVCSGEVPVRSSANGEEQELPGDAFQLPHHRMGWAILRKRSLSTMEAVERMKFRPNSGFPVVIGDPSDHGGILEVCKPKRVVSQREMNYEVQKILVPIKTGCPPQCWRLLHEV